MNIDDMKHEIKKVYRGRKWEEKVDNMHEAQVIAVYLSFKRRGKIK